MAKMVPPVISNTVKSQGEVEIYQKLATDPITKDWIVLHSLDLTAHRTQLAGEADFVVLIPGKGILCLEVKGCSSVRRINGLWFYGVDVKPDVRGPFRQAAEAMHSLRRQVTKNKPDLNKVLFWSAVIFPFLIFSDVSEEWHSWQVIDRRLLKSLSIGKALLSVIENARAHVDNKKKFHWLNLDSGQPTIEQCNLINQILRPDFEVYESPKARSQRRDQELKRFTKEQFAALDSMEENERVLFKGPAGTGKTLLAIEAARRACEKKDNVLFICYNRLLGNWLKDQTAALSQNLTMKTLHRFMLDLTGLPVEDTKEFWHSTLPATAIDRLLSAADHEKRSFDTLIVDEAQDVMQSNYIDFLDLCLEGGIKSGSWRFFGDFEKQAIYGSGSMTTDEFHKSYGAESVVYHLRVNCRNTPRIAEHARLLGGLEPDYSRILRPDNGVEPRVLYYKDETEQKRLLLKVLEKLYVEGYKGENIAVLSTRNDSTSIASNIDSNPWKGRFAPYDRIQPGLIGYSSIHAFKGLEAPAIIVTDVNKLSGQDSTALFYVAVTRSLDRLIILASEDVKKDILNIVLQKPVTSGG